jgi:hypothetical protein
MEVVNKQKIIIILQTNAGYGNLGFDFADRLYAEMDPDHSRLLYYERQIRSSQPWLADMKKNARERNISLDAMIREAAIYMANKELVDNTYRP